MLAPELLLASENPTISQLELGLVTTCNIWLFSWQTNITIGLSDFKKLYFNYKHRYILLTHLVAIYVVLGFSRQQIDKKNIVLGSTKYGSQDEK